MIRKPRGSGALGKQDAQLPLGRPSDFLSFFQ